MSCETTEESDDEVVVSIEPSSLLGAQPDRGRVQIVAEDGDQA